METQREYDKPKKRKSSEQVVQNMKKRKKTKAVVLYGKSWLIPNSLEHPECVVQMILLEY